MITTTLKDDQIEDEIKRYENLIAGVDKDIEMYEKPEYEAINIEELQNLRKMESQMLKEKKKRRRWAKDLLSKISEGMEIGMKNLLKKIDISLPIEVKN